MYRLFSTGKFSVDLPTLLDSGARISRTRILDSSVLDSGKRNPEFDEPLVEADATDDAMLGPLSALTVLAPATVTPVGVVAAGEADQPVRRMGASASHVAQHGGAGDRELERREVVEFEILYWFRKHSAL